MAGLTYVRLAKLAKLDRDTVAATMEGRRRPTMGTVIQLCRVLELHPSDVIVMVDEEGEVTEERVRTHPMP